MSDSAPSFDHLLGQPRVDAISDLLHSERRGELNAWQYQALLLPSSEVLDALYNGACDEEDYDGPDDFSRGVWSCTFLGLLSSFERSLWSPEEVGETIQDDIGEGRYAELQKGSAYTDLEWQKFMLARSEDDEDATALVCFCVKDSQGRDIVIVAEYGDDGELANAFGPYIEGENIMAPFEDDPEVIVREPEGYSACTMR